jgi:hypothetical protein
MSNNTRIEIKSGISDGELVLLNPRLSIAEAREDDNSEDQVNVKDRFGGDTPAQLPPVGPDRAGGKAKGKRGPRGEGARAAGGESGAGTDGGRGEGGAPAGERSGGERPATGGARGGDSGGGAGAAT